MAREQSIFGVFDNTTPYGIWWSDKKPACPVYLDRYDELSGEHQIKSTISLMLGDTILTTVVVFTSKGSEPIINGILSLLGKRDQDGAQ